MKHTPEEQQRVTEYINAFKRIEAHLRTELRVNNEEGGFKGLVKTHEQAGKLTRRDRKTLDDLADLRNVLQHHEIDGQYLSIPTEGALQLIKAMERRLIDPATLYTYMQEHLSDNLNNVRTVAPSTQLGEILQIIREQRFTYLPVIENDRAFKGLLTSNGVAIWLAEHAVNMAEDHLLLVELETITVEQMLPKEEERPSWEFIARDALLREVVALYEENAHLEAVLMTHAGKPGKPMGIVTAYDLPGMREHL